MAPDNPADERLVALAEVRDVTPLRDAAGQVVAFPAVERVLAACLDEHAPAQAGAAASERLDDNRIFLLRVAADRGAAVGAGDASPERARR